MKVRKILAGVVSGLAFAAVASPAIKDGSVIMTQPEGSRKVVIAYELQNEPAIVTLDIVTNGVSIGGKHLHRLAGDVNRFIATTGPKTISWRPDKDWPGNKVISGAQAVVTAWSTNAPPDIMVVSLMADKTVEYFPSEAYLPETDGVSDEIYKTDKLLLKKVHSANVTWRMGPSRVPWENGIMNDDCYPHLVTLTEDFYVGVYKVTQKQYQRIMNARPSHFTNEWETRPVECVSYKTLRGQDLSKYSWPDNGHDVIADGFFDLLRKKVGGGDFDLPLEAVWEFACRAGCGAGMYIGTEKAKADGSEDENASKMGRYNKNGGRPNDADPAADCTAANGTAKAGDLTYVPNDWGFYDMCGSLKEWCIDWYANDISNVDPMKGPMTASDSNNKRVARGCAWSDDARSMRSAARTGVPYRCYDNDAKNAVYYGFRVCCSAAHPQ